MRFCLLTTQELDAQPFPADDWPSDPRPFFPEAQWDVATLKKATSVEQVTRLLGNGYDLFFNLCDGAADQDIPGIEVVQTLEAAGVPFTGATSVFYEPPREVMKAACIAQGIPTPSWAFARTEAEVERAAETLRFPLFVKHCTTAISSVRPHPGVAGLHARRPPGARRTRSSRATAPRSSRSSWKAWSAPSSSQRTPTIPLVPRPTFRCSIASRTARASSTRR
jgi:hypothetical protein